MKTLWRKLSFLFQRTRRDSDLEEELAFHLSEEADDRQAEGFDQRHAHLAARRELGSVAAVQEQTRASWGFSFVETTLQDLRIGARSLRKNPGFGITAICILALGIGASTAVFSVVHAVVLKPLAFHDAERIVAVRTLWEKTGDHGPVSIPDFDDWQKQSESFEATAYFANREAAVTVGSSGEFAGLTDVSDAFFRVFAIEPALGRVFDNTELKVGGGGAAIISDSFWRSRFGGDANVLGKSIQFGARSLPIVGVMPPGFRYPDKTDVWVPNAMLRFPNPNRGGHNYLGVGKLKRSVAPERAQNEMTLIGNRLAQQYAGTNKGTNVSVAPLQDEMMGGLKTMLYLLMGAVCLLLLIACGNVGNLLLARAAARTRELGVRTALGAGRGRIIRQLATESLALGAASWLVGVAIAFAGAWALVALAPASIPRVEETRVDTAVLAFAGGMTMIACLLFGLAPAFRAARLDVNGALSQSGGRGPQAIGSSLRQGLVVAEVAFSVILLTGAGLLIRSFAQLSRVPLGFETRAVLVMQTSNVTRDPARAKAVVQMYGALMERAAAIPGVAAVGADRIPPGEVGSAGAYEVDQGVGQLSVKSPQAVYSIVSPGAFRVLGIPVRRGRDFSDVDGPSSPLTAIVNETLARRTFPGQDPIGHLIQTGMDRPEPMMIVGVVGDIRQSGPGSEGLAEVYMPYQQHPLPSTAMRILVRTAMPPEKIMPELRRLASQLAPAMPVKFTTMEERMAENVAAPRFRTLLLAIFAAIAVVLSMAGVYGVISFLVTQRTQEIGLRMALGADAGRVARMVLSRGVSMAAIGLAAGVVGAAGLSRFLQSMLFEVRPFDPATYLSVAAVVLLVTVGACFVPAWRAVRIDPMRALRQE